MGSNMKINHASFFPFDVEQLKEANQTQSGLMDVFSDISTK